MTVRLSSRRSPELGAFISPDDFVPDATNPFDYNHSQFIEIARKTHPVYRWDIVATLRAYMARKRGASGAHWARSPELRPMGTRQTALCDCPIFRKFMFDIAAHLCDNRDIVPSKLNIAGCSEKAF